MGKSRKRTPVSTWCCCKSQKRGKQICHRKFRSMEREMLSHQEWDSIPVRQREVVDPWELGGDGKVYWYHAPDDEWYIKLMRK